MEARDLLSLIARQLETVRTQVEREERRSESARVSRAVFRSLRLSYLALSTGLNPGCDAGQAFILECAADASLFLRQGAHPLPTDERTLVGLFLPLGLRLIPGQTLLLEPELVKYIVEEALAGMTRDGDPREDRKHELLCARQVAEELMERARVLRSVGTEVNV